MRFLTAGESHGPCLVGIVEGFPGGVPIDVEGINSDLARRQQGYGRGGRMAIERDQVEILTGLVNGETIGSPITLRIVNRDYPNWAGKEHPPITLPRPGHGDFAGSVKYRLSDTRLVAERGSARDTAMRVAVGSLARQLLKGFGIESGVHVVKIGGAALEERAVPFALLAQAESSPVRCVDKKASQAMLEEIDKARADGDTLGGIFEVQVKGVPVGLGSHAHWDRRLDGKLAWALMSIPGIKGVEIGDGFACAGRRGSQVHDELFYEPGKGYYRTTNRAGGIEGGMSNGEILVVRAAMKPIPTLQKPLRTVDIRSHEPGLASVQRSDTCAVPAAAVVGEMAILTVIAQEFLAVFGGDSLKEIEERWHRFQ
jgi:chorismate synthase